MPICQVCACTENQLVCKLRRYASLKAQPSNRLILPAFYWAVDTEDNKNLIKPNQVNENLGCQLQSSDPQKI